MATRLIEELDPQGEIGEWFERLESVIDINAVYNGATEEDKPAKKRSFLQSHIGPEGYKLLKSYVAPETPARKTFEQIKQCLINNLEPAPSAVSESYKLAQIKQETSETISMFMSRVKCCASKCNFGESYDRMVRDRFICGLKSEKIRAHLINDTQVETSIQALSKALARESSDSAAHTMNINAVFGKGKYRKQNNFKFSGNYSKTNSSSSQNDHKTNVTCSKCTLSGHDASNCYTKCRFVRKMDILSKIVLKRRLRKR